MAKKNKDKKVKGKPGNLAKAKDRKGQSILAAEALLADYSHDQELTAFTILDSEAFYGGEWINCDPRVNEESSQR